MHGQNEFVGANPLTHNLIGAILKAFVARPAGQQRFVELCLLVDVVVDVGRWQKWCRIVGPSQIFGSIHPLVALWWWRWNGNNGVCGQGMVGPRWWVQLLATVP